MMRRVLLAGAVVASLVGVWYAQASGAVETQPRAVWTVQGDTWSSVAGQCDATAAEVRHANYLGTNAGLRIGAWLLCPLAPPPTTTVPPTTTTVPPTTVPVTTPPTTVPATTLPPPTTAPPTTVPVTEPTTTTTTTTTTPPTTTTTTLPTGVQFVETFDGNAGLDRFDTFVYHRDNNPPAQNQWPGDHDLACGGVDTQRTIHRNAPAESFYTCRDHMMTSMGDTSGYSIVAFSPAQVFTDVTEVAFDVNLTDLGTRQWWKVGVLSVDDCPALDLRCMYSDVAASSLPGDLKTNGHVIATWSGGLSAGHPGGLMIGNQWDPDNGGFVSFNAESNKMDRYPVTFSDDGAGTLTFTVAGQVRSAPGSFPACPCRVVIYDNAYTPTKSESGAPIGFTFHWDSIVVR